MRAHSHAWTNTNAHQRLARGLFAAPHAPDRSVAPPQLLCLLLKSRPAPFCVRSDPDRRAGCCICVNTLLNMLLQQKTDAKPRPYPTPPTHPRLSTHPSSRRPLLCPLLDPPFSPDLRRTRMHEEVTCAPACKTRSEGLGCAIFQPAPRQLLPALRCLNCSLPPVVQPMARRRPHKARPIAFLPSVRQQRGFTRARRPARFVGGRRAATGIKVKLHGDGKEVGTVSANMVGAPAKRDVCVLRVADAAL